MPNLYRPILNCCFYPTISKGITLHSPFSVGSGGSSSGLVKTAGFQTRQNPGAARAPGFSFLPGFSAYAPAGRRAFPRPFSGDGGPLRPGGGLGCSGEARLPSAVAPGPKFRRGVPKQDRLLSGFCGIIQKNPGKGGER